MTIAKRIAATIAVTLFALLVNTQAQTARLSTVNVTSDGERVHIGAQGDVSEMRVDVADEAGDVVFQSGQITGQQLDWSMRDAQGERVAAGTYLVTVTFRNAAGKLKKRVEQVTVNEAEKASIQAPAAPVATPSPVTVRTYGTTTVGRIPKFFNTPSQITNSVITESGGNIGIGAAPQAGWRLDVSGLARIKPHAAGDIRFGTPNAETGITILRNKTETTPIGRADIRFNGKRLILAAGAGTNVPTNYGVVITKDGNVGIGTDEPDAPLTIRTTTTGLSAFTIRTANNFGFIVYDTGKVSVNLDSAVPNSSRVCWDGGGAAVLRLCPEAFAAYVPTISSGTDHLEEGDLVSLAPPAKNVSPDKNVSFAVSKSSTVCDANLFGFISDPKLGAEGKKVDESYLPIARNGNFPVKVTMENGLVRRGDPITSSSKPGYGMKATEACKIIGYALEDADHEGTVQVFSQMGEYAIPQVKALRAQVEQLQREKETEVMALKTENAAIKARLEMLERTATVTVAKRQQ